jgi:predicted Zn-dependent protease
MLKILIRLAPVVTVMLLAACAGLAPAPVSGNAAVVALVDQAQMDTVAGRLPQASSGLERALRIEPGNPRLWQQLARLRLAQGDAGQAESLAIKANHWSGTDKRLRAANWRLIAEARAARGDDAGAREAAERARALE